MPSRNPRLSRSRPAAQPPASGSLVSAAMDCDGLRTPQQVIAGLRATSEGEDLVQLLTPEGQRVSHPRFDVDVSPAQLQALYRDMVLVRRADREAKALQRQGELGLWAPLLGQEAAQIGAGRAMAPQDTAFPSYREHGVAWCRGVDFTELFGIFRGIDQGSWDPISTGFQLYSIVVGSQGLHATGYAMGQLLDGKIGNAETGEATICFFGDGATSQGDVHEGFVWAAVYDAPVVFFCQNNQWAISEPTSRQFRVPLYQRAAGFGFPGVRVDGNDVFACLAVTRAALEHGRSGQGPMLIEAFTYRMGAHTTSDDPTRYRSSDEVESWRAKDPIVRLRTYLDREGQADEVFYKSVDDEADELAAQIRAACLALPDPEPLSMFEHSYAAEHAQVVEERAFLADYLAGFAEEES